MKLTISDFKQIFIYIAEQIEARKDELSELDRAVGDGDHGVTMSIGWQAIVDKLNSYEGDDFAALCKDMAMSFLNAVGSSVGPLYATAFLRGGMALQGKAELDEEDVVQFWLKAVNGIQERGKAQVGDKTMMDTWIPAMQALEQERGKGGDLLASLEAAVTAGEKGMNSTAEMLSQKGRSSRLGERSVGHLDPGSVSAYIILSSFLEALRKLG
ncbi:PTS-dependent dihydroxyacetone kinase, ADP-binding subunit dhaL [Chlamydia abortus]|uniref:Dihydroxyacetone kinase subunit DhaL n=1 Tax=Paenibacillus residui TaxID=629724 RepID=A0ABW3DHT3_9BACL|nr:PTS-dependent dihydroxyacetone kinase, ADP-binding subunit dhaL [Chlamydia abortus]